MAQNDSSSTKSKSLCLLFVGEVQVKLFDSTMDIPMQNTQLTIVAYSGRGLEKIRRFHFISVYKNLVKEKSVYDVR